VIRAAAGRPAAPGASVQKLGFWMCLALVVGNIIGSGVYLLPASLAPFGRNNVTGWLVTAAGAIALAVVFAALSRELRGNGGPYAATREAFGPLAAFVVAWGYWVSIWVGNAAIATGAVSYTSALVPWITGASGASALVTVAVVWLLTLVNCLGVRAAGWVQAVTTVVKLVPLVVLPFAALVRFRPEWLAPPAGSPPLSLDATAAAATLALWAVLGFESATVPADKIEDPVRTIPRATLVGTLVSTLLCALACGAVMLVVPNETLRVSNAPFADAARTLFGEAAAVAVTLFAAVSAYGALNGWILLQGEVPQQMARDGVFPRAFARTSRSGAPVFALCATSLIVTVLVLMNFGRGMVEVFTFMILLSTTANLVAYLACSLALLVLLRRGRITGRLAAGLALVGAFGAAYSLWAIAGAGPRAIRWGAVLILVALPVYSLMRRGTAPWPEPAQP
jgi:APA family basic amino acid/polyamine antiporter